MKAYLSIYIDLDPLEMTPEGIYLFNEYLAKVKDGLYEQLRTELAVGPANFGRSCKAEHGIKDGRETVEVEEPKAKKPRKPKKVHPNTDDIPGDELPDVPPVEA